MYSVRIYYECKKKYNTVLGNTSQCEAHTRKTVLSGIAQITSPQFGQVVQLFLDVKNDVLARITKPSNNDYDNDGSDYNFGTVDNFGVKNDQKVSHNMILTSKYKGQHGGRGPKNSGKALPPPFSGNAQKKTFFSPVKCSPILHIINLIGLWCLPSYYFIQESFDLLNIFSHGRHGACQ